MTLTQGRVANVNAKIPKSRESRSKNKIRGTGGKTHSVGVRSGFRDFQGNIGAKPFGFAPNQN